MTSHVGRRLRHDERDVLPSESHPGDYWRGRAGVWWVHVPNGGEIMRLDRHVVDELPDGTITVQPTIRIRGGYAGNLVRGIWHDCP